MEALEAALTLTSSTGTPVAFTLSMLDMGAVRLSAELQPKSTYNLDVAATATVLDGYGQPLQGSQVTWTMADVDGIFKPPTGVTR